ncbi:MAG TPA: S8 family serine peptidase [Polyangiaceae bacterium]|nr:S8 family serine peptidase [Polyangiaceae bacterium]
MSIMLEAGLEQIRIVHGAEELIGHERLLLVEFDPRQRPDDDELSALGEKLALRFLGHRHRHGQLELPLNRGERLAWFEAPRKLDAKQLRDTELGLEHLGAHVSLVFRDPRHDDPRAFKAASSRVLLVQPAPGQAERVQAVASASGLSRLERGRPQPFLELKCSAHATSYELAGRLRAQLGEAALWVGFESIPFVNQQCTFTPTDPLFAAQFDQTLIGLQQAWDLKDSSSVNVPGRRGSAAVKVFIVDRGCLLSYNDGTQHNNHEDLSIDQSQSYNIDEPSGGGYTLGGYTSTPNRDPHGTQLAGVIGAKFNSVGIAGVAPSCTLCSLRCNNSTTTEIAHAITQAAALTPAGTQSVVCVGFAPTCLTDAAVIAAITAPAAVSKLIIVFPSGNYPLAGSTAIGAGAVDYPNVIICGATAHATPEVRLAAVGGVTAHEGSKYGGLLTLVAPGQDIPTTSVDPTNDEAVNFYDSAVVGTSIAAAHVAGVAALMLSVHVAAGPLSPARIKKILRVTAKKINTATYTYGAGTDYLDGDRHDEVGNGRVDALAAVEQTFKAPLDATPPSLAIGDIHAGLTRLANITLTNHKGVNFDRAVRCRLTITGFPSVGSFSFDPPSAAENHSITVEVPSPAAATTTLTVPVYYTAPDGNLVTSSSAGCTVTVDVDDGSQFTHAVTANIVQATVVSELVVDRSGSMSETAGDTVDTAYRKADAAIDGVKLYIDLMRNGDRLGIVRFNHQSTSTDVVQSLVALSSSNRATIKGNLAATSSTDTLYPSGSTSIGAGVENAVSELSGDSSGLPKSIVILTDGLENTAPTIASKIPAATVAHCWGIGLGLNQVNPSLVTLTNVTGGFISIVGKLEGTNYFDLKKRFAKILGDFTGAALATDPYALIPPGQAHATEARISDADVNADFIQMYRPTPAFPKYLDTWLEAPDGTLITRQDINDGLYPTIELIESPGHVIFRVGFPCFGGAPSAHVGTWRLWAKNGLRQAQDELKYTAVGALDDTKRAVLETDALVQVKSNLQLQATLGQASYSAGSSMVLSVRGELFGQPLALEEAPQVTLVRPDGTQEAVLLSLGANQTWSTTYGSTYLVGAYRFEVSASVKSPLSARVTRFAMLTGMIAAPGTDQPVPVPVSEGGKPGGGTGGTGTSGHDPCDRGPWKVPEGELGRCCRALFGILRGHQRCGCHAACRCHCRHCCDCR